VRDNPGGEEIVSDLLSAPDRLGTGATLTRAGVVVHPSRDIEHPLSELRGWTDEHDVELVQVRLAGHDREVVTAGEASDCDVIVSIGGDGTMLAAIRAAVLADRPVLGVACGSLGALTAVPADGVRDALDRFSRGDWSPRQLPALDVLRDDEEDLFALNDIAIVRAGIGQVRTSISVDGILFCRIAGDGCIVSTQVGSSAYAIAAGGPLLAPGIPAYLVTPLPTHGGSCPPLVIGAQSELELEISVGHDGARLEVDGQIAGAHDGVLTVSLRPSVATLVSFADQEGLLAGLRRRRIILDSPRILAEDDAVSESRR
jgi:NAD+ kinase